MSMVNRSEDPPGNPEGGGGDLFGAPTDDAEAEALLHGLNEEQRAQLELFIYEQFLDEPF